MKQSRTHMFFSFLLAKLLCFHNSSSHNQASPSDYKYQFNVVYSESDFYYMWNVFSLCCFPSLFFQSPYLFTATPPTHFLFLSVETSIIMEFCVTCILAYCICVVSLWSAPACRISFVVLCLIHFTCPSHFVSVSTCILFLFILYVCLFLYLIICLLFFLFVFFGPTC